MLMENVKYSRSLEITSSYVKFAVGYVSKGVPHLVYYKQKPIDGLVSAGKIVNYDKLVEVLKEFHSIEDETIDIHMEPNAVSTILPSIGFKVFKCDKASTVVGGDGVVAIVDVENVMMLIKRQPVEQGNAIVDVVPDYYVANKQKYKEPPIGVKADSLSIGAKVHTLPMEFLTSFNRAVQDAGFRVLRTGVASFCASQITKAEGGYPESYILFDFGSDLTTVSIIGNNEAYSSRFTKMGGSSLSKKIAESLKIPYETANLLKEKYGYDTRVHQFETPLFIRDDKTKIYQKDLNLSIESFFKEFEPYLEAALEQLEANHDQKYGSFPIILAGGASKLKGIEQLLFQFFKDRKVFAYVPRVIGAREPGAINVLGMIVAEGSHKKASLIESYRGVTTLRRE